MTSRRKRFRNRGRKKERLRKEKEVMWQKLKGQKPDPAETIEWPNLIVDWNSWAMDYTTQEFYRKQILGTWLPDERDSSTSKSKADPKWDSKASRSGPTRKR